MISSPFLASIGRPSRTMLTVSSSVKRTGPIFDVDEEFVAEHADGGHDRARDGRPERTDRGLLRRPRQAGRDVVARVEQQVEVGLAALALIDTADVLFV